MIMFTKRKFYIFIGMILTVIGSNYIVVPTQMALSSSYAHQRHLTSTIVTLYLELLNLATMSLKRLNPLGRGEEQEADLHKQRLSLGKKKTYMLHY